LRERFLTAASVMDCKDGAVEVEEEEDDDDDDDEQEEEKEEEEGINGAGGAAGKGNGVNDEERGTLLAAEVDGSTATDFGGAVSGLKVA